MNIFNKALLIVTAAIFSATLTIAQTKNKQIDFQKVVIQLSSNDTLVHRSLLKQLNNIQKAFNKVTIEVVAHGPGIELLSKQSPFINTIAVLHQRGIAFLVCQNTLNEKKVSPQALVPLIKIIPSGLAHVITRQSEGWSYLKAGF
ncbi:DsrE family protein [Pedobacter immunditicola]|uniref:DsrE family protein n=1 Tax=Pedobacter immunditicola TaxID=3133440 RepID=UPI0030B22310